MPTKGQGDDRYHDQQPERRVDNKPHGEYQEDNECTDVQNVLTRQHKRIRFHPARQLAVRDERASEGHCTNKDADKDLNAVDSQGAFRGEQGNFLWTSAALDEQVAIPAHKHGRQADKGVQDCDEFGHARHLDYSCPPQTYSSAEDHGHTDEDQAEGFDVAIDR